MKDVVLTDRGPKPIGPYSQAIKAGGLLFASGQVALDPVTNEFVVGDITKQTERALENVKVILEAGGCHLHRVVKTTVYLKNMSDFHRDERSLRQVFSRRAACAFHGGSCASAERCAGRNRCHRNALGNGITLF